MFSIPYLSQQNLLAIAEQIPENERFALLLSSHTAFDGSGTRSFLACYPVQTVTIDEQDLNPWKTLENLVQEGMWFGYLGYEMGKFSIPYLSSSLRLTKLPLASFTRFGLVIEVNHSQNTACMHLNDPSLEYSPLFFNLKNRAFVKDEQINEPLQLTSRLIPFSKYKESIEEALEWIRRGDVYQVNLSHQLTFNLMLSPIQTFAQLFLKQPISFAAFLRTPERTILSLSPERFIKLQNGVLESQPIKGTAPRGKTTEEDQRLYRELMSSSKEEAELLMITDLMRNDLGKVCLPNTVHVPHLRKCEAFRHLYHTSSVIRGISSSQFSTIELIKLCFPAGSITGCPKAKAMQLIDKIEQRSRGIYTGSIGWIREKEFDLSVAIRTLDIVHDQATLQLGGGITIDSDPLKEYEETLHKGKAFSSFFTQFSQR